MATRQVVIISVHALRIGRVESAAREKFRTEVGTIYTLVATSHLWSLATALGTPNRKLSITSVSTYVRHLVAPACFRLLCAAYGTKKQNIIREYLVRSAFVDRYFHM